MSEPQVSSSNVFHRKFADVDIGFENNQISISDKLNDTDINQQHAIAQNCQDDNVAQMVDTKIQPLDNQQEIVSDVVISDVVIPTNQQQSSINPEDSTSKTKTGTTSGGPGNGSSVTRKKKSKSKSSQNSQQLDQNQNYRGEVILKFRTFILDNPKIATNFEIAIFNKSQLYCYDKKKPSGEHSNIFKNGVYQPFFQKYFEVLEPNNYKYNDYLFQQICNNQLQIQDYVQLEDDKLRPQVWQKIINKKQVEMSKIEKDRNLVQATSMWYVCSKCNGNSTITSKKQTRSADEGETIFILCQRCGNSWTQY